MLRKRFYRPVGYPLFLNFIICKRSEEILEPNPEEFRCGTHKNQFCLGVVKVREEIFFGRVSEFERFHLSGGLQVFRVMGKLLNRILRFSTLDDSNFFCYFLPATGLTLIGSDLMLSLRKNVLHYFEKPPCEMSSIFLPLPETKKSEIRRKDHTFHL